MTERSLNKYNDSTRQQQIKDYYLQGKTWSEIKNLVRCSNYSISKALTSYTIAKGGLKGGYNINNSLNKNSSNNMSKNHLTLSNSGDNNADRDRLLIMNNQFLEQVDHIIKTKLI